MPLVLQYVYLSHHVCHVSLSPWILPELKVDLALLGKNNKDMGLIFGYILYTNILIINIVHTYASKCLDNRVGVAFFVPEFHILTAKRISDNVSVYTGEMLPILLAVQWI